MGSIFLTFATICLSYALLPLPSISGPLNIEFIYPNFVASNLQFVEHTGAFLSSRNGTFNAAIFNPQAQQTNFYFSIVHTPSNTIIWSANRNSPISNSGNMNLSFTGITVVDQSGNQKWSTPTLKASVAKLQLLETGNLVLLDQLNRSLWESFNHPTDTIVMGQRLPVGVTLLSALSESDLSAGVYRFSVTGNDGVLLWNGLTYWRLSMDPKAYSDLSSLVVAYMAVNSTGLYLFAGDGVVVVLQVSLPPENFRIVKLDNNGRFIVKSFTGTDWDVEVAGPGDNCRVPFICGRIGVCTDTVGSNANSCSCPPPFHQDPQNGNVCLLTDTSFSLPSACNSNGNSSLPNSSTISYVGLGIGMDYFANYFSAPLNDVVELSACKEDCSKDCSCLGLFYDNSSGSCYLLKNQLGSIMSSSTDGNDRLGYIKVIGSSLIGNDNPTRDFPIIGKVLLPFSGLFGLIMILVIGIVCWRRRRLFKTAAVVKSGRQNSCSDDEFDEWSIIGLPIRFDYEQLEVATNNFETHIGSGGFGSVYRGTLPDNTHVAVKKITNLGGQGKKEFCTEIAIIGNIHHVNLVRLRGFCAQGRNRFLVYEYMNRGSLDRTLFSKGPVLEWQERVEIALGTARGLAYLHSGCSHKIIHCDIKPENILLHDNSQVKISDFGLSKLLSPEQSNLFTTMRGTRGYLAPEWLTSSTICEKTDVYSYGIVLLEIIRGRKNYWKQRQSHSIEHGSSSFRSLSTSGSGAIYFPLLALEMHEQGRYLELADPRLEGRVTSGGVEKLVRVALCCVHEEPALRPTMATVVSMLEGGIPLGKPRIESLNFLRFYGRRFAEASTIEGRNDQENEFMLYPQAATASQTSTTSGSHASLSYMSSQQISGPR